MDGEPPDLEPLVELETSLVSFVVRFVCDAPAPADGSPAARWHGVIRHVQSSAERHFTRWDEAVAFIAERVELHGG